MLKTAFGMACHKVEILEPRACLQKRKGSLSDSSKPPSALGQSRRLYYHGESRAEELMQTAIKRSAGLSMDPHEGSAQSGFMCVPSP